LKPVDCETALHLKCSVAENLKTLTAFELHETASITIQHWLTDWCAAEVRWGRKLHGQTHFVSKHFEAPVCTIDFVFLIRARLKIGV
jgi:hypothetical protein